MRSVLFIGIAFALAACANQQPLLDRLAGADPCQYVGALAERAETEKVRREAEAKGRSWEDVEMAPIRAGERIPAAGKVAWARCRLHLAGLPVKIGEQSE